MEECDRDVARSRHCKVMSEEYDDMSDLFEKRKKEIGETAELVSKTTSAYLHDDTLGG